MLLPRERTDRESLLARHRGLVAGQRHGRRKEAHRAPWAGSAAWVIQVAELFAAVRAAARGAGAEGALAPEVAALSLVALAAGLVSVPPPLTDEQRLRSGALPACLTPCVARPAHAPQDEDMVQAAGIGDLAAVQALLARGVSVNCKPPIVR